MLRKEKLKRRKIKNGLRKGVNMHEAGKLSGPPILRSNLMLK